MRIIAGTFRSRRLKLLKGLSLRPTSDMMRETLFNILGPRIEGSRFLDLFAGTGAVGIEAISRGAAFALFVENHSAALRLIRENLAALAIQSQAPVTHSSAVAPTNRENRARTKFHPTPAHLLPAGRRGVVCSGVGFNFRPQPVFRE